jgi:hypothetical protein
MTHDVNMQTQTSRAHEILFEGFRSDEILRLPSETLRQLVLLNEPIVFRVGSATILGRFAVTPGNLVVELAQIEGGGEGVLPSLAALARRYAELSGLSTVEWIVHAVSCANPNLKLRRVLGRRGFRVEQVGDAGLAYHLVESVNRV